MNWHLTLLLPSQAPWAQTDGSATSSPEAWTAARSCAADEATTPCVSNASPAATASLSGAAPWSAECAKMWRTFTSASPARDPSRSCRGDSDKSKRGWRTNRRSARTGRVASSLLVYDAYLTFRSRDTIRFHPQTITDCADKNVTICGADFKYSIWYAFVNGSSLFVLLNFYV